ncbi:type IV pilus biogenesis protein PilM [Pseudomonas oryzihabitans]
MVYATNGHLVSPSSRVTGIALPAAVPAGSAVAYR